MLTSFSSLSIWHGLDDLYIYIYRERERERERESKKKRIENLIKKFRLETFFSYQ